MSSYSVLQFSCMYFIDDLLYASLLFYVLDAGIVLVYEFWEAL